MPNLFTADDDRDEDLIERGSPPPRRASGPSGKHAEPRRKLTATAEQWDLWEQAVAASRSASWAEWARDRLTQAAAIDLGIEPEDVTDDG